MHRGTNSAKTVRSEQLVLVGESADLDEYSHNMQASTKAARDSRVHKKLGGLRLPLTKNSKKEVCLNGKHQDQSGRTLGQAQRDR